MRLIQWELAKIWRRRAGKIALACALGYALFATVYNGTVSLGSLRAEGWGTNADGPAEIARQYAFADAWKGPLTQEVLVEAMQQFKTAYAPQNVQTFEDGTTGPSNATWDAYIAPLGSIPDLLRNTFGLLPQYSSYYAFPQLPLPMVADYYAQRETLVQGFLETQLPDETDRALFCAQNAKIKTPFVYDWVDGQWLYLNRFSPVGMFAALFCAIALAPVFAGEAQRRTDALVLSARHGRSRLPRAKLCAALCWSGGVYVLCSGVYCAGQLLFLGTRGLDSPIQLVKPIATAPLTFWQAELFALLLGLLGCLALTGITLFFSARLSSAFPVIIIAMLVLFLPMLGISLPGAAGQALALLPFAASHTELFRTNLYHIFGAPLWSPWAMLLASAVLFVAGVVAAGAVFRRKESM